MTPLDVIREYVDAHLYVVHEALEEVAKMAGRDGHGMVVEKRRGVISDAYVSRWVPAGTAFVIETDLLDPSFTVGPG